MRKNSFLFCLSLLFLLAIGSAFNQYPPASGGPMFAKLKYGVIVLKKTELQNLFGEVDHIVLQHVNKRADETSGKRDKFRMLAYKPVAGGYIAVAPGLFEPLNKFRIVPPAGTDVDNVFGNYYLERDSMPELATIPADHRFIVLDPRQQPGNGTYIQYVVYSVKNLNQIPAAVAPTPAPTGNNAEKALGQKKTLEDMTIFSRQLNPSPPAKPRTL